MLRAIRFVAQLPGFRIEGATATGPRPRAGLLATVSTERIVDELYKGIRADPVVALRGFAAFGVLDEFCRRLRLWASVGSPGHRNASPPFRAGAVDATCSSQPAVRSCPRRGDRKAAPEPCSARVSPTVARVPTSSGSRGMPGCRPFGTCAHWSRGSSVSSTTPCSRTPTPPWRNC